MATRFYLNNRSPLVAPATNRGSWSTAASSANISMSTYKADNGAAATKGVAEIVTTNPYDVLMLKLISYPLWNAVNFSTADTVQWVIGALETASALDVFHVHIYVSQGDNNLVRGTLLVDNIGATEFPTTATGRGEGTKSLANNVAALKGDRIIIELGYRTTNTTATSKTGTFNYGNTGATDLTAASTSVTTQPGWIEFSTANMMLASGISDNFDDGVLDTGLWETFSTNTTVAETGGLLTFTTVTAAGYAGYDSFNGIDLTGGQITMQVVNAGNQAQASLEVVPISLGANTSTDRVFWYINGGTLGAYKTVATVQTLITSTTYNSAVHKYFKIRESGGTTFFDYSTDGKLWTNFTSLTNPITMTCLQMEPSVGHYAVEAAGTTVTMDNFNILPIVGNLVATKQAPKRAAFF